MACRSPPPRGSGRWSFVEAVGSKKVLGTTTMQWAARYERLGKMTDGNWPVAGNSDSKAFERDGVVRFPQDVWVHSCW